MMGEGLSRTSKMEVGWFLNRAAIRRWVVGLSADGSEPFLPDDADQAAAFRNFNAPMPSLKESNIELLAQGITFIEALP